MYAAMLLILKVASDVLVALFGMLGLLFDFKDEHKMITKMGKIALIGILASFSVSCVTTILEAKKGHDEKNAEAAKAAEYERKVERLSHPFGEFELATWFVIHGPPPALRKFLNSRHGSASEKDMPEIIKPFCCGLAPGNTLVLYRKGVACSDDIHSKPDLVLTFQTVLIRGLLEVMDPRISTWYLSEKGLSLHRLGKLKIVYDDGEITSADDLPGGNDVDSLPNEGQR
jgi:hypothetical protein